MSKSNFYVFLEVEAMLLLTLSPFLNFVMSPFLNFVILSSCSFYLLPFGHNCFRIIDYCFEFLVTVETFVLITNCSLNWALLGSILKSFLYIDNYMHLSKLILGDQTYDRSKSDHMREYFRHHSDITNGRNIDLFEGDSHSES